MFLHQSSSDRLINHLSFSPVLEWKIHSLLVPLVPHAGGFQRAQEPVRRQDPEYPTAHRYHPQRLVWTGRRILDQDHRDGFPGLVRPDRSVQAHACGQVQKDDRR